MSWVGVKRKDQIKRKGEAAESVVKRQAYQFRSVGRDHHEFPTTIGGPAREKVRDIETF